MGMFKMFSKSSLDNDRGLFSRYADTPDVVYVSQNPDPLHYKIKQSEVIGTFLLLWVNYPDCKNYEGNKILLFQGVTLAALKKQKAIDPHFSDSQKYHHPIARFVPTEEGWAMAQDIAKLRSK
jgi:hypothetical protein